MSDTARRVHAVLTEVATLVEGKNAEYGDAALHPRGVLAPGWPVEGLVYRIDEKLARLRVQLEAYAESGASVPGDTIRDLIGSFALLLIALEDGRETPEPTYEGADSTSVGRW